MTFSTWGFEMKKWILVLGLMVLTGCATLEPVDQDMMDASLTRAIGLKGYTQVSTPADADALLLQDASDTTDDASYGTLKYILFSDLFSDYQPLDSGLTSIAALSTTSYGRALLAVADEAGLKTLINLEAGIDFQAYDAFLADIAALTDPGADRLAFWDDSAGDIVWLTLGTGLSITGTTISSSGGSGTVDTSGTPVANDIPRFTDADTVAGLSYAEFLAALDLEVGTDFHAYDAMLADIAAFTDPGEDQLVMWDDSAGDLVLTDSIAVSTIGFSLSLTADDTCTGLTYMDSTAGETIAQWETVYYDSAADEWLLSDADAPGEWPARGLAIAASTDGNALTVLHDGTVRNDAWNWTPKSNIYHSDTPGGLTQTALTTSGDCHQLVGWARSADIAVFKFNTYGVVE